MAENIDLEQYLRLSEEGELEQYQRPEDYLADRRAVRTDDEIEPTSAIPYSEWDGIERGSNILTLLRTTPNMIGSDNIKSLNVENSNFEAVIDDGIPVFLGDQQLQQIVSTDRNNNKSSRSDRNSTSVNTNTGNISKPDQIAGEIIPKRNDQNGPKKYYTPFEIYKKKRNKM